MAYAQKDNTGSLFVNAQKTSDKHPDRKGSALIDGEEWEVAGWIATDRSGNRVNDKNGNPILNVKFSRKSDRPATKAAPTNREPTDDLETPF